MAKFKLSKFFPDEDIQKLKDLAVQGIHLYPLLWSNNKDDINYALGILEANKIKIGKILRKETKQDNPVYNYDGLEEYCGNNSINLLTRDELFDNYLRDNIIPFDPNAHTHQLAKFTQGDGGDSEENFPMPVILLKYIRYIQQDGKL